MPPSAYVGCLEGFIMGAGKITAYNFKFGELKRLQTIVYKSSPDYLYRRNGIYYFAQNAPSDLKTRLKKSHVVMSLHTRSVSRAQKLASVFYPPK